MSIEARLRALASRWADVPAGESANFPPYITELTQALELEPPRPRGSGYEFEHPVKVVSRDGRESTNFIDLYKEGCFVLEAKHSAQEGASTDALLRRAFGQALSYANALPGSPPPYLLVLDVARTLLVWDRWQGGFGGFNLAHRIALPALADRPEDVALLRDIWTEPAVRDPRARAAAVTREVAGRLAELSASLERRGIAPERVARFLMRCVFTMFAEDVGLLPDKPFQQALQEFLSDPDEFTAVMQELWRAMDEGRRFGLRRLLRFNGHFFAETEALPLTRQDMTVLLQAAKADWTHVEPTIFGTLLVRALDPAERHRLGAEYTPREYVERLVRQTVEVPLRDRWAPVQAEVLQLTEAGRKKDTAAALARLREFHEWMRGLRFLDPACGSGNFLYVTLHSVKRVELEVLREIERLTGQPELPVEEVDPRQFHGIEIKPWAREIAELTLWIGFHQFWQEHHKGVNPREPVLKDTGTLELRDAVLAWDEIVHVPEKDRPDPTPRLRHPVTGKLVPDAEAKLPYHEYRGARPAEWPHADFIIGNPPYIGNKRMREAHGDGYVDALRSAYPHISESADFVMYWWDHAARVVGKARTIRAGLITTNSITQTFNRLVVERAMREDVSIVWAIADHPWVDEAGSAAVRVAMTVLQRGAEAAIRVEVNDGAEVVRELRVPRLNADLSTHADVAGASSIPLIANRSVSLRGFTLVGRGFVLDPPEAERLLASDSRHADIVRPYLNGKDLAARPRRASVIDFALRDEDEARSYPVLYDIVRTRVKPERDANKRESRRRNWWRFGEANPKLRDALRGLPRFLGTPYVAKHHFFTFLDAAVAPDEKIVVVASDNAFELGVLSSTIHEAWALVAGSRLGIGNDPTYNNSRCFDPFPFPAATSVQRGAIADVAETLDRHRKEALARDEKVTMTGMYNVLEKLRSGEALTPAERHVHEVAACGVLLDLHEALDRMVASAYGWPWPLEREEILERLVALHGERVEEEKRGAVRWLRPEYQIPRFGKEIEAGAQPLPAPRDIATATGEARRPWPERMVEQLAALQEVLAAEPVTAQGAAARFGGASPAQVRERLELLAGAGEVWVDGEGRYNRVEQPV